MSAGAIALILLYFVPTGVAKPRDRAMVAVVNLFTGWTIIGWVVALAMAVRPQPERKP